MTNDFLIPQFKTHTILFLTWLQKDNPIDILEIKEDIKRIEKIQTFEEIETILTKYDDNGLFTSFVTECN